LKANTAGFVAAMTEAGLGARKAGRDIEGSFSRLGSLAGTVLAPLGEIGQRIAPSRASRNSAQSSRRGSWPWRT